MADDAFPIIAVHNVLATQRFYERLGFRKTFQFPPEGEPGFLTLERGSSTIGIGTAAEPDEPAFRYWVYVDDVDATFAELCASGAPVVTAPENREWGE